MNHKYKKDIKAIVGAITYVNVLTERLRKKAGPVTINDGTLRIEDTSRRQQLRELQQHKRHTDKSNGDLRRAALVKLQVLETRSELYDLYSSLGIS